MKFIHTSDWHLGHTLYEHSRGEEQKAFLDSLADLVKEHKPDALIVSGDVFDRTSPSIEARNLFTDTLLEIHRNRPAMEIVVTAGNHDGKASLNIEGHIWNGMGIHLIAQVERLDDRALNLDRHIIEVPGKGFIVAVPHIYEAAFPAVDDDVPREKRMEAFFHQLMERVAERNVDKLPVVLSAHLWIQGSDVTGHDLDETRGGQDLVQQEALGGGYDYLALGHIHLPQTLKGTPMARYCGSPLPISFDEGGSHGVSLVTINAAGKEPQVEHLTIDNPLPLLTIPAEPASFNDALDEACKQPDGTRGYLRLNVLDDGTRPADYVEQIKQQLSQKELIYCTMSLTRQTTDNERRETMSLTADEIQNISPIDVMKKIYSQTKNAEVPDDFVKMMEEVREILQKEDEARN